MSKTETLKQSAAAANVQDLTEKARAQVQEVQTLLEQVKARSMERPLTAEELERRIEPMLATMVALAQMDMTQLETASEATAKAAAAVKQLSSGLSSASSRAEAASETFRETLMQQWGWEAFLCLMSGLIGAGLLVAYLVWAGGLKPSRVTLEYSDIEAQLTQRLCVIARETPQPQPRR